MAEMRRCIGTTKFGIEAHEAPVEDFPKQPSQKDGLGRMCRTHWNQYTTALRKAAEARKAAEIDAATDATSGEAVTATTAEGDVAESEPPKAKRGRRRAEPAAEVEQVGAGGQVGRAPPRPGRA